MRVRWFVFFIISMLVWLPARAAAQAEIAFDKFQVAIWPEYDRPEALVIYRISLDDGTTLPAQVNLRIPVAQPNAVAMMDMDGALVNLNYTSETDGPWTVLSFDTPVPDFQIEYYDALTKDGNQRNFAFRWPGGPAVRELSVQVLQPVDATAMEISQYQVTGELGQDGLTYYNYVVGELPADTPFKLDVSYQKPNDKLSFEAQVVEPVSPVDSATSGRRTMQEVLPMALIVIGVLAMVAGGLWLWQARRDPSGPAAGRRRHDNARKESAEREPAEAGAAIYCHQCGKRAANGDVFCRTCGTKLRS